MIAIPKYTFTDVKLIEKGVSDDKKYRVRIADGCVMLLRLSDISNYKRKKTMFDYMKRVAALGIPMSRPIDFGISCDGKDVFQLLSWCNGDTAEVILPTLSEAEQYKIGLKAGKILQTIQSIPSPDNLPPWYDRFFGVQEERVKGFSTCGVEIKGSDMLFSYYEHNKHLLRSRPQTFTHGDYHLENLLIGNDLEISVVDWDLFDDNIYGDPWNEFGRILNATVFPHYTTGLLRGYFDGEPPEEFWPILKFYLSIGALLLVTWAAYISPRHLDESKQAASDVIQWYDSMRTIVPSWYLEN